MEGRRTAIHFPNGTTPPVTTAGFDVTGNLLALDTDEASSLLPLRYGYDRAGNRVSLVTADDTFDYRVDEAGRLVEESINRFVERSYDRFILGSVEGLHVDPAGSVSLLPFADSLTGSDLDLDRWRLVYSPAAWRNGISDPGFVGLQVRQDNGLQMAFPRGYSDVNHADAHPFRPDTYGFFPQDLWVAAEHRTPLSGDFDLQVDFAEFQGQPDDLEHVVGLWIGETPFEAEQVTPSNSVFVGRSSLAGTGGQSNVCKVYLDGVLQPVATTSTSDGAGKFRIVRSGSTMSMSSWDGAAWVAFSTSPFSDWSTADVRVALVSMTRSGALGSVVFRNLVVGSSTSVYPATGSYTSTVYDAGRSVTWDNLSLQADAPTGTALAFVVEVADDPAGAWAASTSMTSPGAVLDASDEPLPGRFARYTVTFTGDGTGTPILSDVQLSFSGANASNLRLYGYDGAGNMVGKTVITDDGVATEVRNDAGWSTPDRLNNLNQIKRNDVTPAGGTTVSWRYLAHVHSHRRR